MVLPTFEEEVKGFKLNFKQEPNTLAQNRVLVARPVDGGHSYSPRGQQLAVAGKKDWCPRSGNSSQHCMAQCSALQ